MAFLGIQAYTCLHLFLGDFTWQLNCIQFDCSSAVVCLGRFTNAKLHQAICICEISIKLGIEMHDWIFSYLKRQMNAGRKRVKV